MSAITASPLGNTSVLRREGHISIHSRIVFSVANPVAPYSLHSQSKAGSVLLCPSKNEAEEFGSPESQRSESLGLSQRAIEKQKGEGISTNLRD